MLDDIRAIVMDIFHQGPTVLAIIDYVLVSSRWAASLDYDTNRIRRSLRRMRNVRGNEERLALVHDVIDNAVALADAHLNVALELVEIFLRIDQMKIIPRIWSLDDHDKKIPSIVKVTIAHRRLELFSVFFDPSF